MPITGEAWGCKGLTQQASNLGAGLEIRFSLAIPGSYKSQFLISNPAKGACQLGDCRVGIEAFIARGVSLAMADGNAVAVLNVSGIAGGAESSNFSGYCYHQSV